ncbi:MAG TPA: amidohydrolase [Deltaproteobacteria bacterium]|nr:amidohydrolase [Deltaproteobacteria bacterium]MDI9542885.1 amidohydrolase [Pseudomonadota bacterium]HRR20251.1 amidohydrolase [Desulfomonilia bacterium]HPX49237.1 amidohydrolase [Deltaproteobacteria bacterium]HQA70587.1 amidohydrolase [Deltaproteobacteria bacterium]
MKSFAVRGGYIVKGPKDVVSDSYVIVEGTAIREITPQLPEGITEVLGGPDDIVMPGLVNTHTHAAMTLFRGYADDLPLMTWLQDYIFPAEARFVDKEFVYLGTLLAAWEMTRSGTTAFCDGYFFEDQVGRAAKEVGIRAWLGEGILQFPSPSLQDPARTIEHSRKFIGRWLDDPLVRPTVFPHAVYTCSTELLQQAYALAEEFDLVFQIHLSETAAEVEQIREKFGLTPVRLLESLGCLSGRTLAAHCVHLDDEEIALLARTGVSVAHNAESNMKLASGIAPVPAMIAAGVNVTVGTDGCASNNNLDMISELSTVAKLHKVSTMDPTALDDCTALALATENAARALKFMGGRIEPGRPADIITLDGRAPNLVPIYNPVSHVVYAANGSNVRDVVIDGRIVVKDFTSLTVDEEALVRECRKIRKRIAGD